jgi:hypothetical protein
MLACENTSFMDPDFGQLDTDPDPGGQKRPQKKEKVKEFIVTRARGFHFL